MDWVWVLLVSITVGIAFTGGYAAGFSAAYKAMGFTKLGRHSR
jgi:hypothetical protein